MISISSLIGIILLVVLIFVIWRIRPSCEIKKGDVSEGVNKFSEQCDTPDAHDWCTTLEGVYDGTVFCFDESLRLKAIGNSARHMIPNSHTEPHMVDIAPPSATSDLLEMMALARRKTMASKDVLWEKRTIEARATPVGKNWIALCIKIRCEKNQ